MVSLEVYKEREERERERKRNRANAKRFVWLRESVHAVWGFNKTSSMRLGLPVEDGHSYFATYVNGGVRLIKRRFYEASKNENPEGQRRH